VLGIAEYGTAKRAHGRTFKVADIPGLIEGAHAGKGLGDKFLRHIERTKMLIHIIDMAGVDQRDPLDDFLTLNNELEQYGPVLGKKSQIIVANKIDLPAAQSNLKKFKSKVKKDIIAVSALTGEGIEELKEAIAGELERQNEG